MRLFKSRENLTGPFCKAVSILVFYFGLIGILNFVGVRDKRQRENVRIEKKKRKNEQSEQIRSKTTGLGEEGRVRVIERGSQR